MALPVRRTTNVSPQSLQRWEPFREFEQLQEHMDRLMHGVWSPAGGGNGGAWMPVTDVEETDDAWVAHEAVDHLRRPDICIFDFNRVRLTIANPHHAGLSEAELRLARTVDAILTAEPAAQRAATDGRAWTVPPTRSARSSRTTSARRVVQEISS